MKEGGIFIPPWFEYHEPSCSDWAIVSIVFGMTLCLTIFGLIRVSVQTYHQWKRANRITTYMVLIWLELIASGIIGGLGWGYVRGTIRPGYVCLATIWRSLTDICRIVSSSTSSYVWLSVPNLPTRTDSNSVPLGVSNPLHYANYRQPNRPSSRLTYHRAAAEMGHLCYSRRYQHFGFLYLDTCSVTN